jgi:hypothetical protein
MRAKFYVESTTHYKSGGITVRLNPVLSNTEENKSFWEATPSGHMELQINNPSAIRFFDIGAEYYVDFIPSDPT